MAVAVHDFTLERLERLLASSADVFWRHDVDFDPGCAVLMARLEHEHGVCATFYVMVDSNHYRVRGDTLDCFREIASLGHRLGVHTDLGLPRDALVLDDHLHYAALTAYMKLRAVLPVARAVSFHAPPRDVQWRDVPGFEHAMSPAWEGRFVADSRGRFAHGQPEEFLAMGGPVQVALHSEWWMWGDERAAYQRQVEAEKP